MSSTMIDPLPLEIGQLGHFEARMKRSFQMAINDWDEVCTALGEWEAKHLAGEGSASALEQHRGWVTQLLAWGQLLRRLTGPPGFSDRATAKHVRARLRHLEDKLSLWHREMTREEEDRIMRAAFP